MIDLLTDEESDSSLELRAELLDLAESLGIDDLSPQMWNQFNDHTNR